MPRRYSVWKRSRMMRHNLQKSKSTCTCKCRRALRFPLAFQLAILQVKDYSVYGSTEGRWCGNFGQNSVSLGRPNAFSNRFNCRITTNLGKSAIAIWINKFREHDTIHRLNSKISMTLRHSGSPKCTGIPRNIIKVMESVAKISKSKGPKNLLANNSNNLNWAVPKCAIGIWRYKETFLYYTLLTSVKISQLQVKISRLRIKISGHRKKSTSS